MKSALRFSKASGSTHRRIERIIRNGWIPGLRPSDFYRGTSRTVRGRANVAPEISLGSTNSSLITGNTTACAFLNDIRTGKYAPKVAAVRAAVVQLDEIRNSANQDELAAADKEIQTLKMKLPAVLWNGIFKQRNNTGVEKFSGYLCADIDNVRARIVELREISRNDQHVVASFVSPSDKGFKIVFRVPIVADVSQHLQNFKAVRDHVSAHYGATVDEAAKDIARLCYVSHDPVAYYNPASVPLEVRRPTAGSGEPLPRISADGVEQGGRNNGAFKLACDLRDAGRTQNETLVAVHEFAAKCNPPLPEAEADSCVCSAFTREPRKSGLRDEYLGGASERKTAPLPDLIDAADFLALPIDPPDELDCRDFAQGQQTGFRRIVEKFQDLEFARLGNLRCHRHGLAWTRDGTRQSLVCQF